MDLADLEVLAAVVATGSLSAAAERLGRSQPTVSRRVARLEEELDACLLTRSGRGTTATTEGELVVEFANEVIGRYSELLANLRENGRRVSGSLRIIASTAPATFLPGLLAGFAQRQPCVRFDVALADSAAVMLAVADGRADVGFSGRRDDDERLEYEPVTSDEIVLVVPGGHRFAARRRVSVDELRGERFVLREHGSGTQQVFLDTLATAGYDLGEGTSSVTVGSAEAVVAAVAAGLGIGVVSESAIAHRVGDVVSVRFSEVTLARPLWLVRRAGDRRPPHHEAFVSYVLNVLAVQHDHEADRADRAPR